MYCISAAMIQQQILFDKLEVAIGEFVVALPDDLFLDFSYMTVYV